MSSGLRPSPFRPLHHQPTPARPAVRGPRRQARRHGPLGSLVRARAWAMPLWEAVGLAREDEFSAALQLIARSYRDPGDLFVAAGMLGTLVVQSSPRWPELLDDDVEPGSAEERDADHVLAEFLAACGREDLAGAELLHGQLGAVRGWRLLCNLLGMAAAVEQARHDGGEP